MDIYYEAPKGGGDFDPSNVTDTIVSSANPMLEPVDSCTQDIGRPTKRVRVSYNCTTDHDFSRFNQQADHPAPPPADTQIVYAGEDDTVYTMDPSGKITALTTDNYSIGNLKPSTGLLEGGNVFVDSGNTTYTVSSGVGQVVKSNGVVVPLVWATEAGIIPSAPASDFINIYIDQSGDIKESTDLSTPEFRRENILLATILRPGSSATLSVEATIPSPLRNLASSVYDLANVIGAVNASGNDYSGNSSMELVKSAGAMFRYGSNFQVNSESPHIKSLAGQDPLTSFVYLDQVGVATTSSVIDPDTWDNNGTLTAVPNNDWSIQRISLVVNGDTIVEYGQATYNTLNAAKRAFGTEQFNTVLSGASTVFRFYLFIVEGCNDLTDPLQAEFLEASLRPSGGSETTAGVHSSRLYTNTRQSAVLGTAKRGMTLTSADVTQNDANLTFTDETIAGQSTALISGFDPGSLYFFDLSFHIQHVTSAPPNLVWRVYGKSTNTIGPVNPDTDVTLGSFTQTIYGEDLGFSGTNWAGRLSFSVEPTQTYIYFVINAQKQTMSYGGFGSDAACQMAITKVS